MIKKYTFCDILSFILGLTVCTNAIYVFQIGNTPVLISYLIAYLGIAYLFLFRNRTLLDTISHINRYIFLYFAVNLLSFFLIFISFGLDTSAIVMYLKGIILFFSGFLIYLLTISLDNNKCIVSGILVGILLNIVISLIAFFKFNNFELFSLYNIFPQKAFAVCVKWGINAKNIPADQLLYAFRAQGLFLEASHFAGFLIVLFLPIIFTIKNKIIKFIIFIITLFLELISATPNFIVFLCEIFIAYVFILNRKKNKITITKSNIIFIFIVLLFFSLVILNLNKIDLNYYFSRFDHAVHTLNLEDANNSQRLTGMKIGINYIKENPLGIGYNLEPYIFKQSYDGLLIKSSFSFLIRLVLETGLVGAISYIMIIIDFYRKSRKRKNSNFVKLLGLSCVFCLIVQFVNGITILPYIWLMFGLIQIETSQKKEDVS